MLHESFIFSLIPIVAIIFGTGMIVFSIWLGTRARVRRIEMSTELQNKVLEKFGTASEFTEFLGTAEGRQWMTSSTDSQSRQADKILGSLKWGLIGTALGCAFLILSFSDERDFVYPALLIGSIGAGFLAHTYLGARLARMWGLMPNGEQTKEQE